MIDEFVSELQTLCNKHRVHLEGGLDFSINVVVLEDQDGNPQFEALFPQVPEYALHPRLTYYLESSCSYGDDE